jgi:hypothetical protein
MGNMDILVKLIWFLIFLNIVATIFKGWRLSAFSKAKMNDVPPELVNEVKVQLNDGYKLSSVNDNTVKLIKIKRFWFPWVFIPLIPLFFNTGFLNNVYGVELQLIDGKVKLSTF